MMENKQMAEAMYDIAGYMHETLDAMRLLYEHLEAEGFQREDNFDKLAAVVFAQRFPAYLSAFSVMLRDLERNICSLDNKADALCETET